MRGTKREVLVFGCGGHGKVVASVARAAGMRLLGFLDEDREKFGRMILGIPVMGGLDYLDRLPRRGGAEGIGFIAGVGDNRGRRKVYDHLIERGIRPVSALHPSCIVDPSATIGDGTVAMAGVIVNAESRIGSNVILNTGVSVDHDCVIGDHAHLAPGVVLAGGVRVGEGAFLGVGVCAIPGITIGAGATVGAGGVVVRDVPAGGTVAGVPAKPI